MVEFNMKIWLSSFLPAPGVVSQSKRALTPHPQQQLSVTLTFLFLVLSLLSWGRSLQRRCPGCPPRQLEPGQPDPPGRGTELFLADC